MTYGRSVHEESRVELTDYLFIPIIFQSHQIIDSLSLAHLNHLIEINIVHFCHVVPINPLMFTQRLLPCLLSLVGTKCGSANLLLPFVAQAEGLQVVLDAKSLSLLCNHDTCAQQDKWAHVPSTLSPPLAEHYHGLVLVLRCHVDGVMARHHHATHEPSALQGCCCPLLHR